MPRSTPHHAQTRTTRRAARALALALALGLAACASTPAPTPDTPVEGGPQGDDAKKPAEGNMLGFCEEFFHTLNAFDTSTATAPAIALAEASARDKAELCRQTFLKAAETPGSKVVAEVFGAMILIRAFELSLDRRAMDEQTEGVCADTRDALDRIERTRARIRRANEGTPLEPGERRVLADINQNLEAKHQGLDPFFRRGCKGTDTFDPARFVSVDDLKATPKMSADACFDLLVAFAAFDLEKAPRAQTERLIKLLNTAQKPCMKHLSLDTSGPVSLTSMERANQGDLMRQGPLMLGFAVAMSEGRQADACAAMKSIYTVMRDRTERLKAIADAPASPPEVKLQASGELELATQNQASFEADYQAMCSM